MVTFVLLPLLLFFVYSFLTAEFFGVSGPLTLDNYAQALTINGKLAWNSGVVGFLVAVSTVCLALPVAYWLRYAAGRKQLPILSIIAITMLASYLVRIYAWRSILGEHGLLNSGLKTLGIIDQPLTLFLFNRFAITVALVHIFLPYVVLVLYAGMRPISPELLESAQDLGADAPRRWLRVVLPLMAAPLVASFMFVFVLSASDYVTPQFLGSTNDVMMGVQIQTNFKSAGNWPLGAASSFLMLGVFAAAFGLSTLVLKFFGLSKIDWTD